MENLKLLENHKRKTILWHAFVKFIFIYMCVLIFLFTSVYFRNVSENKALLSKVSRVTTIVKNQPVIQLWWETQITWIEKQVLEGTYIYNSDWGVLSYINDEISGIRIPTHSIKKIDDYKYYSTELTKWDRTYYIIARLPSNNFLSEIIITLFIIVLLWPILYFFLFWVSKVSLRKVYQPIEDIIASLEWFAVNINHEFKTSLSEIISSLELAHITKEYEESSQQSIDSAKRLNSTLDSLSLLIHFVNSDYRREKVNIIKELDASLSDFSKQIQEKDIQIIKKYNLEESIDIVIDKAPLLLCFTNIFKNAIRYSKEGGDIEIYIEKNCFKIKDYWVGIAKKNLEKIFERYFRETYAGQGTGIGLSLVKRITDIYKWDIKIDSKKNKYTEIILSF